MANKGLSVPTVKLHEALIRLVKGALKAWEEWLKAHQIN